MQHEKTIFLQECLEAIFKRTAYTEGVINGVQLMQEIILHGGDINIKRSMTESDYFNCLCNTKMADGNFMTKESAEILSHRLINWKPMII